MSGQVKTGIVLELYYDSTVEPFANPKFEAAEVIEMLRKAESSGFTVRLIDTAGWGRELLMERYRQVAGRRGLDEIFGPRGKRGWFFGREVPALVVLGTGMPELYPARSRGSTITVSDYLRRLLGE